MWATATNCSRLLLLAGLLAALPAFAALDDSAEAVGVEAQRLGATWKRPPLALAHPVHQLAWPDGSTLRQHMGADGRVWALSWNLRTAPRLDLLLGPHHEAWRAAARAAARPGARHAARVEAGDLVVEMTMNGNAYQGRAWLRSRQPAGQGGDAFR